MLLWLSLDFQTKAQPLINSTPRTDFSANSHHRNAKVKIAEENQSRLITVASTNPFAIAAGLFGTVIFFGPDFATAEMDSSGNAMRWTGAVIVGTAMWLASSKRAVFDADLQEFVWRQRMTLVPFSLKKVVASFSSITDVKITKTNADKKNGAMIHVVLDDQRELQLTHPTTGRKTARKLRARILGWINQNAKQ